MSTVIALAGEQAPRRATQRHGRELYAQGARSAPVVRAGLPHPRPSTIMAPTMKPADEREHDEVASDGDPIGAEDAVAAAPGEDDIAHEEQFLERVLEPKEELQFESTELARYSPLQRYLLEIS